MKNSDKNPVIRTKEERKAEMKKIVSKLTELELTIAYKPVKQLFVIIQNYIQTGGKTKINIPFTMINKRVKGLLSDTINENCVLKLEAL